MDSIKDFNSVTTAASQCHPMESFDRFEGLSHLQRKSDKPSPVHYSQLARHCTDTEAQVCFKLNVTSVVCTILIFHGSLSAVITRGHRYDAQTTVSC